VPAVAAANIRSLAYVGCRRVEKAINPHEAPVGSTPDRTPKKADTYTGRGLIASRLVRQPMDVTGCAIPAVAASGAALPMSSPVRSAAQSVESDDLQRLIARVREGDLAAFDALYRRTRLDVQKVLYQMVGSNADMEDLIQETYIQLLTAVKRFRGESRFSTFLYRVCANVGLMYLRSKRRRPEDLTDEVPERESAPGMNPEQNAHVSEAAKLMRTALSELTPKKQVVLVYHDIMGLGPEEIAHAVGSSANTVRSRLFHARREFAVVVARLKKEAAPSEVSMETQKDKETPERENEHIGDERKQIDRGAES
jgi:RNA polymerase sigma-70 factor, ECF subfamily